MDTPVKEIRTGNGVLIYYHYLDDYAGEPDDLDLKHIDRKVQEEFTSGQLFTSDLADEERERAFEGWWYLAGVARPPIRFDQKPNSPPGSAAEYLAAVQNHGTPGYGHALLYVSEAPSGAFVLNPSRGSAYSAHAPEDAIHAAQMAIKSLICRGANKRRDFGKIEVFERRANYLEVGVATLATRTGHGKRA